MMNDEDMFVALAKSSLMHLRVVVRPTSPVVLLTCRICGHSWPLFIFDSEAFLISKYKIALEHFKKHHRKQVRSFWKLAKPVEDFAFTNIWSLKGRLSQDSKP